MSTSLRIIERPPTDTHGYQSPWDAKPGDMWRCPSHGGSHDVEGRAPCWVIRLPDRAWVFHTNMKSADGNYWTVTGEPPKITITPSINVGPEIWHGFITNGEMTP